MADEPALGILTLPRAALVLFIAGASMVAAGVGLILIEILVPLGSAMATGGIACLLAGFAMVHAERQRAADRAEAQRELALARTLEFEERSREASKLLAARLHERMDHSGQHFVDTTLLHPTNLDGKRFGRALLGGAQWMECSLAKADFTEASLPRAHLADCIAPGAIFCRASLDGAALRGIFTEADFTGAQCRRTDFSRAMLYRAIFASSPEATTYLRGARFTGTSDLDLVDFSRANCGESDFAEAMLYSAVFTGAYLGGASFDHAKLYQCDFTGAMLAGNHGQNPCSFDETVFSDGLGGGMSRETTLAETWLVGVDLSRAIGLEEISLEGALVNPATQFPPGFDAGAQGALTLHLMSRDEAIAAIDEWHERHAKAAGW